MTPAANPSLALLALDFPPSHGGIQTLTWEIYSRLADITRVVVAPSDLGSHFDPGLLPLERTRHAAGTGAKLLPWLSDAVGRLDRHRQPPLLLHCNHLFAGYAGWWMRRRYGIPYLVWVHGEELSKTRHPSLARACLAGAAAILTNSDFTAGLIRTSFGAQPPPAIVKIPLGATSAWIEAPFPSPPPDRAFPLILTVARLSRRDRYKGIDTALRAVAHLRRRGLHARYRIVGQGDDQPFLEQLARELDIADRVEFLGAVSNPRLLALYDDCDVFLLCSREQATPRGVGFEGFGIVFLEAAARGKPVVGGRSGGVPDAVLDGVTGLLVDPLSAEAVADGLARLLRDPGLRARLGQAGRGRVEAEFNWNHAAARVRALHLELCP